MSAGYATRARLHKSLHHPDVHGDVSPVPPVPMDKFLSWRALDEPYYRNAAALGTPGEAQRARAIRLENRFARFAKPAILLVLGACIFMLGMNAQPRKPTGVDYRIQKAQRLPAGGKQHMLDEHERCLVFLHNDVAGAVSVALVADHC